MTVTYSNIIDVASDVPRETVICPEEQKARVDLALAYRLFDWMGITDLTHTHISVRVPGRHDQFLQLPYGHLFSEARASNMVKCDTDGNIISDPTGLGISRGGFCIHSAIHVARPDAAVVMHAHSTATIVVGCQRDGLRPWTQHAMMLFDHIAYLDYTSVYDTAEKRQSLPDALGDKHVLMLRNHGPLVVGRTPWEAFSRMYFLEKACEMQLAMQSAGAPIIEPNPREVEFISTAFQDHDMRESLREWLALERMMQARDPSYAE